MDNQSEKEAFGIALALHPDDAFKAACAVFGDDSGSALRASQQWVRDPVVIAAKLKFIEENGKKSDVPAKEEMASEILKTIAQRKSEDGQRFVYDARERLQAYELVAKLLDYMPKTGAAINVTQNNDNRTQNVMYVPQPSSDDSWADRLEEQQRRLTSVAAN